MCFNKETSINTFFVTLVCSVYLFKRNYENDRCMAFFFMVVSLMQLAEYFMWKDLKCGNMNRYATKLAFIVLVLEPLIALVGCYYFSVLTIDKKLLKKIILIYVVLGAYFLIKILGFSGNLCSKPFNSTGNSHLVWDLDPIVNTIPKFIYYLFIILYFMAFFVFLFFKNKKQGIIYFCLYLFMLLTANILNIGFSGTWKSYWCWIVNIIPILGIFIGYYMRK